MFQFSHAFSMFVHQNTNTVQEKSDPKTQTPGPWTPLQTWSTDHSTDWSTEPPLRPSPPQKDNNKNDN